MLHLILNTAKRSYCYKNFFYLKAQYFSSKRNMIANYNNNPCIVSTSKPDLVGDDRWKCMHNRFLAEAKSAEAEVLFLGDSIIQLLQFSTIWNKHFSALHCLNFGIGGDRVEHVLWRVNNGELNLSLPVEVVVLLVGTNNTDCTAQNVFEGICKIVDIIQEKLQNVSVILPTLLPRGQFPNVNRDRNSKVNQLLMTKYQRGSNVDVVPIHENIIQADESISHHTMHDYLHLTDQGYTKIFTPLYDKIVSVLKERKNM